MADEKQRHRQLFERYCRQKFHDGGRGCSKTISSKKRDKVIQYLNNKDVPDLSAHFRFWVKNRGFQMVRIGGKAVLCLPNKQRVSVEDGYKARGRPAFIRKATDQITALSVI